MDDSVHLRFVGGMLKQTLILLSASFLVAAAVSTAIAGDDPFGDIGKALDPGKKVLIDGTDKEVKRDCGGLDVQITGKKMRVTLTGDCKNVEIKGEEHQVEIGAAAEIKVTGVRNTVVWVNKLKGNAPKVTSNGTSNK